MSTTSPVRALVCATLARKLRERHDLAGVDVLDGPDLADTAQNTILIGDVEGSDGGIRNMKSGRKQRVDEFTITVLMRALTPQNTAAEARATVERFVAALDTILAEDPLLDSTPGLQHAVLAGYDGPDAVPTPEGCVGFIEARVQCTVHLI